jgi:hypothetical protein
MPLPLRLELSGVEAIMLDVQFRSHSEIADIIIKSGYRRKNGEPGLTSHPGNDTRLSRSKWITWRNSFMIGGKSPWSTISASLVLSALDGVLFRDARGFSKVNLHNVFICY